MIRVPNNVKGGNLGMRGGRIRSSLEAGRRSCHQRGRSPLRFPRATTLMVRRWDASEAAQKAGAERTLDSRAPREKLQSD